MPQTTTKLPFEILSYIFILSSSSNESNIEDNELTVPRILSLGQVCSYWRRVASATPRLWTKFLVRSCNDLKKFDLRAARTCLSHCSSLPLSLHIRWGDIAPGGEEDRSSFTEFVNLYSRQWTLVDVRIFLQDEGVEFITKAMRSFTSLTELKFSFPTSCPPPAQYRNKDFTRPSERSISLRFLERLSLNFQSHENPDHAAVPILKTLNLPSLSSFTLLLHTEYCHMHRDDLWDYFMQLLSRSKPPFKSIRTSYESLPVDFKISHVLQYAPMLEKGEGLYLTEDSLTLLAETSESGEPEFARNMTEIWMHDLFAEDEELVLQVLSSRWLGGKGPLKKVIIMHMPPSLCVNMVERVKKELRGLEVVEHHFVPWDGSVNRDIF